MQKCNLIPTLPQQLSQSYHPHLQNIKSAHVGINEYINRFLKSENVRIKNKLITFEDKLIGKEWKTKEQIRYPGFEVEYPGSKLEASEGGFLKGEIISILGEKENRIGKPLFKHTSRKDGFKSCTQTTVHSHRL